MKKYIVVIVLLLFFPILFSMFSRDASVYAYMGTLFFDGKTPYIDGWDHKGISLYLINAFGYLMGFKHYVGIRVLEIILISYSFLSIFKALSEKYTKQIAFIGVVFGLLSLSYFFDGGNLTEEYGAIFVLISVSLLIKEKIKTFDYIFIGVLFLVNFTIRANLISFWIAMFFAILLDAVIKKEILKKAILPFSKMGIGIGIFSLFLAVYFFVTNSFSEFYNAAFTYNFSYAKRSVFQTIGSVITSTRRYEVSLVMLLGFVIAMLSLIKKRSNFISLLLLFWIPIELYFSNMSGQLFAHYYMMWIPIIVLATTFILDYFKIDKLQKEKQFILLGITAFLFFQVPIFNTIKNYKSFVFSKENKHQLISNHINTTYKDKNLLVWGNEISVYNLTHKRATVPYFYQTFFKVESNITREIIADFTTKFMKNPPDLLVDVKTPSLLFLDQSNSGKIDNHQKENLATYFKFVQQNYTLKETRNGVDFYIRK